MRRAPGVILALSLVAIGSIGSDEAAAESARFVAWTRAETPPLALKDLGGRERSLAEYRGKVVLLNFWATWCEPCRDEMPSMRRLREAVGGHVFDVVAVNYGEPPSRVRDFLAKERLDLTVLLDPDQSVAKAWRVRILPSSFLVGPDGRVRFSVLGELEWSESDALTVVRSLLPARGGAGPAMARLVGRAGR